MSTNYRPDRRKLIQHGALASAAAMGAASMPWLRSDAAAQLSRNETLFTVGMQWGPPTNFSPIAPTSSSTWPVQTAFPHMYEQLCMFNVVTGELEPLLAESHEFSEDNTEVIITLHEGTAWADGTPLTAEDVAFTFDLPNNVDGLPFSGLTRYISGAEAVDDRTVRLICEAEANNPGMVRVYLQSVPILPKHIWEPLMEGEEPITNVIDMDPIASGPYKISQSNAQQIVLERRDDYWGNETIGQPNPKYLAHPIPSSNDDANLAFSRGDVDLSQNFIPQVWQIWEEEGQPAGTWFKDQPYHIPGAIPALQININRPGLDNKLVRRALAHTINYEQVAEMAMSRYSNPMKPSLILTDGAEAEIYDEAAAEATGWSYNPEEATRILEEELGATKGDDGIYVLEDGTRLGPWKVMCPYGWTDWMTALEIVVQGGRDAGFDLETDFPEAPIRMTNQQNGDFDFSLHSYAGVSAAGPWQRFSETMDSRGVPELGQTAFTNFNRFSSPEAEEILDQIPSETDPEAQKDLYTQLDDIYRDEIPSIGLMYRPSQFYSYNETAWQGFPNEDNDYAPPMHLGAGIRILSQIEPIE